MVLLISLASNIFKISVIPCNHGNMCWVGGGGGEVMEMCILVVTIWWYSLLGAVYIAN